MSKRVFVSGYGIVSALGKNADENVFSLQKQQSGISKPDHLTTRYKEMMVGEVKYTNEALIELTQGKGILSRTALLGLMAVAEAIKHAGLSVDYLENTALLNGTSVGGMDVSEKAYADAMNGKTIDYAEQFSGHDCGHSTQVIAKKIGLKGYLGTISTACSSSANTLMHGARLIKSGTMDCVIAGGTDALSIFTLNGFNALKILDTEWCKPFDQNRKGLNLGEGAAFLVLESEESLQKRGGRPLAALAGYGNANDAYHQTASSPEGNGAYKAIEEAFRVAGIRPEAIDYINAHGTGTTNNDQSESLAISKTFGTGVPPYSSTKAFTGHTLGAAGAIEAVFSVMALEQQCLWPSLNITEPMDLIGAPVADARKAEIKHVLSNSFGFGGNCSSLIFSGV